MTTWDLRGTRHLVLLCNGDTCAGHGSEAVTVALRRALREHGLDPQVHTARTRCLGRCDDGCTVVVHPDGTWYRQVTPSLAEAIVEQHLMTGCPVQSHVSFVHGPDGMAQVSGTTRSTPKPGGRPA